MKTSRQQPRRRPVRYREAANELRTETILDTLRDLLIESNWRKVSVSDIAARCGLSRQTIYKNFGSRDGLIRAYMLRFASGIIADLAEQELHRNVGDLQAFFTAGFERYFAAIAAEPLAVAVLREDLGPELFTQLSGYGADLVETTAHELSAIYQQSWLDIATHDSDILAQGVVRIAISYIAIRPNNTYSEAHDLGRLFAGFAQGLSDKRDCRINGGS